MLPLPLRCHPTLPQAGRSGFRCSSGALAGHVAAIGGEGEGEVEFFRDAGGEGGVPRDFPLKYSGPEELKHLELVIALRGMVA